MGLTMYTSTREKLEKHASDVILNGLSDEGGLFILENLDDSVYSNIVQTSYHDIAYQVFSYFLDDYPKHMIESIIEKSYGHAFNPYIVGLNSTQKMTLMTLYHGPTFAFKDIALQALPHMYDYAKKIQGDNRKTIILTATSGDTGGAALDGFSKLADTIVIILYPTLGVSEFQQKQMKSYQSDSCYVFGIDGDFDDCQHIVKTLFQELELKHVSLSSANSINMGRIIAQVVYYMYSYKQLVTQHKIHEGAPLDIVVPSGNFGNVYAAYLAKRLGTPLGTLVIASNKNNVLTQMFNAYHYTPSQKLFQTLSPSMDILVSSNLERYLYHLNPNAQEIKTLYKRLKEKKETPLEMLRHQHDFKAYDATETQTLDAIKMYYDTYQTLIDPHTAVGYYCYEMYHQAHTKNHTMIVSTASPYKFPHAVLRAFDHDQNQMLGDAIESLKVMDQEPFDDRIYRVLKGNDKDHIISLDATKAYIKKVIESYDIPS